MDQAGPLSQISRPPIFIYIYISTKKAERITGILWRDIGFLYGNLGSYEAGGLLFGNPWAPFKGVL